MTDTCPPEKELLRLGPHAGPDDARDPLWEHVRTCPRCRSVRKAHQLFLTKGTESPGDREAVGRLTSAIEDRILGSSAVPAGRRETAATRSFPGRSFSLRDLLRPRVVVPALGAAAVLFGLVLIARDQAPWREAPWRSRSSVLRETAPRDITIGSRRGPSTPNVLIPSPPRPLAQGRTELRWPRVPSADSYRVRLLGADLTVLRTVELGTDNSAVVDPSPSGQPPAVFFEIEAVAEGETIAVSRPRVLKSQGE